MVHPEFDKELSNRYYDLWSRQNELLWSRLKTLATLQVGIFAGWYVLQRDHDFFLSMAFGIFGVTLSWLLKQVIVRDGVVRDHFREQLRKGQPGLEWPPMPSGHLSGLSCITSAANAFLMANLFMTTVSIFYFGSCHHCD